MWIFIKIGLILWAVELTHTHRHTDTLGSILTKKKQELYGVKTTFSHLSILTLTVI